MDGCMLPKRLGGHPALDLCNTLAGWGGPALPNGEWLVDAETLIIWCRHAGLLDSTTVDALRQAASERPAKARALLSRVRELRANLYGAVVHEDDLAFAAVADVAHRAARSAILVAGETGAPARWELPMSLGLDLPWLALGQVAAELLTSEERSAVRVCPGHDCGWLFVDRRGTRRWCSMQTCGNRAKARTFAARHQRSGG